MASTTPDDDAQAAAAAIETAYVDDDELVTLALAADPDTVVGDDAVCLWDLVGRDSAPPLPEWYMPMPAGGRRLLRGWRRRLVFVIIAAFVLINAYGLCSTYGQVVLA